MGWPLFSVDGGRYGFGTAFSGKSQSRTAFKRFLEPLQGCILGVTRSIYLVGTLVVAGLYSLQRHASPLATRHDQTGIRLEVGSHAGIDVFMYFIFY